MHGTSLGGGVGHSVHSVGYMVMHTHLMVLSSSRAARVGSGACSPMSAYGVQHSQTECCALGYLFIVAPLPGYRSVSRVCVT